jgi:hypothetical protein
VPKAHGDHLGAAIAETAHVVVEVDEPVEVGPEAGAAGRGEVVDRPAAGGARGDRDRAGLDEAAAGW